MSGTATLDAIDRLILNTLQDEFPICEQPFETAAARIGLTGEELIARIRRLIDAGVVSRFGPLYNAERMGGAFTLAAIGVPEHDFDRVAAIVGAMPEVAHNYARDHALNMWFVLATERGEEIAPALARIERETGYPVVNLPKEREYFVNLKLDAERPQP